MKNGNLVTTIEIKDRHGLVVDTKEVVTYAGLLNRATQDNLKKVYTELIQLPSEANEMTAICMAEVETDKGVFRDYGDANPGNVSSMIVPHIIRMASTRAKARAFRDAVNIGVVALEELGAEYLNGVVDNSGNGQSQNGGNGKNADQTANCKGRNSTNAKPKNPPQEQEIPPNGADDPMTENQRRFLFRLLAERDITGDAAHDWLKQQLGVDSLQEATKHEASDLINVILNTENIEEITEGAAV
jgi:hypothetical protein